MKTAANYLADLVRISSPSFVSNRPVIEYAADALHALGWSTRGVPYRDAAGIEKVNFIAAPPGENLSDHAADLVLMSHTDTVPYAADWADALNPIVRDGHLHGCGSCDVKAFLACALAAASSIDPGQFLSGLRVVLTADEEIGCIGASHLIADGVLHPRHMIIGEPTSLHPARAGKGYCLAEVIVYGKEAHSAHPDQGVSAIAHAADLIMAIQDLASFQKSDVNEFFSPGYTTLNIGTIEGGTAKNIVPGECRFQLEWRPIPGQSADAVREDVAGAIKYYSSTRPGFRAEIRPVRQQPGFETPADAHLVRRMESLAGRPAVSVPFGTEASIFASLAEEIVVFGPGDMRTAHSNRECVSLAEIDEATALLRTLMLSA